MSLLLCVPGDVKYRIQGDIKYSSHWHTKPNDSCCIKPK